jgi:hypothetical protein
MSRVAVKYKDRSDITIYKIVCFKNGKNEILIDNVKEFLKNPNIESYEMIEIKSRTGNSEGGGKNYESKYEKESNKLPKAIAKEVIQVATSLKGCTKDTIDRWNTHLDFDLNEKLNGKYGFTGAKRLYNIFGL